MSKPATVIRPEVAVVKPAIMRMVVVLPAPLGPRKPTISPFSTVNDRSWTIVLDPKRLETDSRAITSGGHSQRREQGQTGWSRDKKGPPRGGPSHSEAMLSLFVPAVAALGPLVPIVPVEYGRAFEVPHELQAVDGLGVVQDAVVEPRGIAVHVLLHPDGVLGHDHRLAGRQLDLHRLVTQRVARRAVDHDAAVAVQIVVALEFEEVEVAGAFQVSHDESASSAALELLREPALIQFLFLQYVDRVREHLDVAYVIQVRVRRDH